MIDKCVDESIQNLTSILEKARLLAQPSHAGQFDKAGKPYFVHVEKVSRTVGELINSWNHPALNFLLKAQIVGYLHDILEDTEITGKELNEHEIPEDCILAIEAITKVEGMPYQDYLDQVRRNKLASVVKIADMMHNSDLTRLEQITEKDLTRQTKYQKAIAYLSEFTCGQCGKMLPLAEMGERPGCRGEIVCWECLK